MSATISPRDVVHAFSRETGLPLWLLDDEVPLDLEATREQFAERVIGQPEAVSQVVDLLATMKAGLNREHKPLASFLFLGPTGVGKTELAKVLAAATGRLAGETLRELPATEWGGRQGSDLDFAHDGARRRASRDLRR